MPINIVPKFLKKAFAESGLKTDIPLNANLVDGRAGYVEGFPPINMTAVAAGGIPPFGQDMNGVLYDLSAAIQYQQSGVLPPFNSAFATAIGGYEVGAVVSDTTDKSILWINGTANNLAHPTGWAKTSLKQATESLPGVSKVGTQSEINEGVSDSVAVTPKKLRAGFAINLASNGYIAFPTWMGGLIIQWGGKPFAGASSATWVYPIAFPNGVLKGMVSGDNASVVFATGLATNSQITLSSSAATNASANIFVIGS